VSVGKVQIYSLVTCWEGLSHKERNLWMLFCGERGENTLYASVPEQQVGRGGEKGKY
jgi:hypothetical protein